jgi:EAL domain-containing protein (putative c-di-GMP-specific phosphodiesterase class I)
VLVPARNGADLSLTIDRTLQAVVERELATTCDKYDPEGAAAVLVDTRTGDVLTEFRDMGVRLAVDDFGTGYSALSYLRKFPVSTLKIDRSFIRDINLSSSHRNLVEAIIAMAHGLDLKTIAEGVENAEQAKLLTELNCDMVQGFYYSKAVSASKITKLFSPDRSHVVAIR